VEREDVLLGEHVLDFPGFRRSLEFFLFCFLFSRIHLGEVVLQGGTTHLPFALHFQFGHDVLHRNEVLGGRGTGGCFLDEGLTAAEQNTTQYQQR